MTKESKSGSETKPSYKAIAQRNVDLTIKVY